MRERNHLSCQEQKRQNLKDSAFLYKLNIFIKMLLLF